MPDLDVVIVPISGGGMISGIATSIKGINPACVVLAAEPVGVRPGSHCPPHHPTQFPELLPAT